MKASTIKHFLLFTFEVKGNNQSRRHNQETTTMKPSFADAEVCSKFLFRFCLLMGPSSAPATFIDKNWFYPYRFNTIVFTHQKQDKVKKPQLRVT